MIQPLQALALAGLTLSLLGCQASPPAEEPVVRPVLTKTLAYETPSRDSYAGVVVSKFETTLGFREFGVVIERSVEVGDLVAAGQQLAQIDASSQELGLTSAQANLNAARAQYNNLLAIEQRQRTLLDQSNIASSVYESAEQALRAGEAALKQAQTQLDKANEQLSYTSLRSDTTGVVTAVDLELGETVAVGQPVVTVVQPELRKAVISLLESQSDAISLGDRFSIVKQLDPSVSVQGTVAEIAPEADPVTRTVSVDLELDDPTGQFRLGSTVLATRSLDEQKFLVVPETAVLAFESKQSVWTVDPANMTVSKRRVALEPYGPDAFVVSHGLNPGDIVVIAGGQSLVDGQEVRFHEEGLL